MTDNAKADLKAHWNKYYSADDVPVLPSQFSVFVANEFGTPATMVEFGCGNGRDSLFFARHGWRVIGVDASESAISSCAQQAKSLGDQATFVQASVSETGCYDKISELLDDKPESPLLGYARFFLHAIDEPSQNTLLDGVRSLFAGRNGMFAVEFRTQRDADQSKATPDHYRRFINPTDFAIEAAQRGFDTTYFTEGFGLAKYKDDDAHVARFLLTPRAS